MDSHSSGVAKQITVGLSVRKAASIEIECRSHGGFRVQISARPAAVVATGDFVDTAFVPSPAGSVWVVTGNVVVPAPRPSPVRYIPSAVHTFPASGTSISPA